MKMQDIELIYMPGQRSTAQKQKGKKNYQHQENTEDGVVKYNGNGFKEELTPAKLSFSAFDENGEEIFEDIKEQILDSFNRQKLSEPFVNKLENALNNLPEVICEKGADGKMILSESTLEQLKQKIK